MSPARAAAEQMVEELIDGPADKVSVRVDDAEFAPTDLVEHLVEQPVAENLLAGSGPSHARSSGERSESEGSGLSREAEHPTAEYFAAEQSEHRVDEHRVDEHRVDEQAEAFQFDERSFAPTHDDHPRFEPAPFDPTHFDQPVSEPAWSELHQPVAPEESPAPEPAEPAEPSQAALSDSTDHRPSMWSSPLPVSPLESVLRRPIVFAVAAAIGLLVSALVTLTQPKTYYAETTLTVVSAGVNGESVPLDGPAAASTAFAFSRYGFSTASAEGITKRTRLTTSQAFPALTYNAAPNSPFVTIRASGATPGSAFRLADAASESLQDIVANFRSTAEQRLTELQANYDTARSNTLAAEAQQLDLQTELTALQNDLLFEPNSTSIKEQIAEVRSQLRAAALRAESNRAKSEAQLGALTDASTQIENGLQLRTFTETFLAGSDGGLKPNTTSLVLVLAGLLLGIALTTMLENRDQLRISR